MLITTSIDFMSVPDIRDFILYDHEGVVAINKPAGMISRGSPGNLSVVTMTEQLRSMQWPDMPHVVHRLDQYTTGALLIARNKEMARGLSQQFEARGINKQYWALIDGTPAQPSGIIDAPIPFYKTPDSPVQNKSALTEYHTMQTNESGMSVVCFKPHTGRSHQLRIHAANALGAPILGDRDYHPDFQADVGRGLKSSYTQAVLPPKITAQIQGQMLHAQSISFTHPFTDERVTIQAPLPPERQNLWHRLGFEPGTWEM
jgi:23S rRNA pseudouridine955/2504/2580 synthase